MNVINACLAACTACANACRACAEACTNGGDVAATARACADACRACAACCDMCWLACCDACEELSVACAALCDSLVAAPDSAELRAMCAERLAECAAACDECVTMGTATLTAEGGMRSDAPDGGETRLVSVDSAVVSADDMVRAWISKETVDRYGTVFVADGCRMDAYQANPVVLWAHDLSLPSIGRASNLRIVAKQGVQADIEWAPGAFAQEVGELYRGGFMSAFSVRAQPDRAVTEMRGGEKVTVFPTWELRETSAVTVPGNADALVRAATQQGSDAAGLILRAYYPEARDANEAARVALDIKRLAGAAESLRNIGRHHRKIGSGLPWQPDALRQASNDLAELLGQPLVGDPPATPAPQPQPDAADGEPSAATVRALTQQVEELTGSLVTYATNLRATIAAAARDEIRRQRQAHIGRLQ